MSNRMLSLIFGAERFAATRRISATRRFIMAALADRVCGEDLDFCYPGIRDVSERTDFSVSTVHHTLAALCAEGWLTADQLPAYGTGYRFNVARLEASQRPARHPQRFSSRLHWRGLEKTETEPSAGINPPAEPANPPAANTPATGSSSLTLQQPNANPPADCLLNRKNPKEPNTTSRRSRGAEESSSPKQEKELRHSEVPRAALRNSDPRHAAFRSAVEEVLRRHNVPITWGPAEASQLANLLRDSAELDEATFSRLLTHLAASEGGVIHQRPCTWLPTLQRYGPGPLDRFGKPKTGSAAPNPTRRRSALEKLRESL